MVKDFTTHHTRAEVDFYMGPEVANQQTFKGLIQHLMYALQLGEPDNSLTDDFLSDSKGHTD